MEDEDQDDPESQDSDCDGCLERKENLTVDEQYKSVNLVFQHKSDAHRSTRSTCVTIIGRRARKIRGQTSSLRLRNL